MIKNMMTSLGGPATESVKVVTGASGVAYVYYGGAHLFDDYFTNHVSVN